MVSLAAASAILYLALMDTTFDLENGVYSTDSVADAAAASFSVRTGEDMRIAAATRSPTAPIASVRRKPINSARTPAASQLLHDHQRCRESRGAACQRQA